MRAPMPCYDAQGFCAVTTAASPAQDQDGARVPVHELIQLLHIEFTEEALLSGTAFTLRRVHESESLVLAGDVFHSLYVVRSGCFKSVYTDISGREQVLGFPMSGDLMGAEGIDCDHYSSTAVSLGTSEVVTIPFAGLVRMAEACPKLQAMLHCVLSRQLLRVQNIVGILRTLGAEGRVAAFLLSLSARLGGLGYSPWSFNLPMTRQDIGGYLGLTVQTVRCALSALHRLGIIQVRSRHIDIVYAGGLRRVIFPNKRSAAGAAIQPDSPVARIRNRHNTLGRELIAGVRL